MKGLDDPCGKLCIIFAIVADVNRVVHYGATRGLEDYFQESGRDKEPVSRTGEQAYSLFTGVAKMPQNKD